MAHFQDSLEVMQTITLREIEHGGLCPPQMLTEQTGCLGFFWLIEFSMGGKKKTCATQDHFEDIHL